jgi:hypothetical protein
MADLNFALPHVQDRRWHKAIDTAATSPEDIVAPGNEAVVPSEVCSLKGHSVVVLISQGG